MSLNELKIQMALGSQRKARGKPSVLPAELRPSAYLLGQNLEDYVAQVRAEFQGGSLGGGATTSRLPGTGGCRTGSSVLDRDAVWQRYFPARF